MQLIVNTTWPTSDFADQPLLVSEFGVAENVSDVDQADSIAAQAKWIKNVDNQKFLGACLFEFSNELWKASVSQDDLGIVDFPGVPSFCDALEPSNSLIYRVDALVEKPAYSAYKAVVNP